MGTAEDDESKGPKNAASHTKESSSSQQKAAQPNAQAILPSFVFSCASIGMIILNKAVMRAYPHAGILLILQSIATIVLLMAFSTGPFRPRASVAIKWMPIALLFCFNLFSSLQSMNYIGVATFSVLRYLQPGFSVPIDYCVRNVGEHAHVSVNVCMCACVCVFIDISVHVYTLMYVCVFMYVSRDIYSQRAYVHGIRSSHTKNTHTHMQMLSWEDLTFLFLIFVGSVT